MRRKPIPSVLLAEHLSHSGRRDLRHRFWAKVVVRDECWGWTGCKTNGYGSIRVGRGVNSDVVASRLSYIIANGPFDDGLFVLHSCDNPECTNPAHLRVGTPQDNMDDMSYRGRSGARRGESAVHSKLSDDDALAVREAIASGERVADIAKRIGVPPRLLQAVARGATYQSAGGPIRPNRLTSERTHCQSGHQFTAENTSMRGGVKICRECTRTYQRNWMRKKHGFSARYPEKDFQ